jgi:CheY-like chemotaxis protein
MNQQSDILLVEDEPVVVDAACRILNSEGFTVDEVPSAEEALKRVPSGSYKLIISDLMLPGISGIELIKKIKILNATVPIIIITGYAMLENAVKSFKVGAFDLIPKPFDFEELLGVVYRAMKYFNKAKKSKPIASSNKRKFSKEKYYFLGQHSWAKIDQTSVTTIGVGESFSKKMGTIKQVEFPMINSEVWQGNLCVRFMSNDQLIHMVWAPLSGKIIEINNEIEKNPNLINTDPVCCGWLIKIIPINLQNELENLVLKIIDE